MNEKRFFYVSPEGCDSAAGTQAAPFRTMAGARDALRRLVNLEERPAGGYEVIFAPGTYPADSCCGFDVRDSGTAGSPTVYRAEKPGTVRFYGGRKLRHAEPVTDPAVLARLPEESRGRVFQCDLKAEGMTDLCPLLERGAHINEQDASFVTVEFFFNGKRMNLSRWPKTGFLRPKRLVEPGVIGGTPSILEYDSPRHDRWAHAEDLWLFGYFRFLWADAAIRIAKVDTERKFLIADGCYSYKGSGSMSNTPGIRYYAFNLLEELSEPGEWYLNRNSGILYFYPPENPENAVLELGNLPVAMVSLDKVSFVNFENLDFDLGRSHCITMSRCEDCTLKGVNITRFAENGVTVCDGFRCKIESCVIGENGRTGVDIRAGDRATLTSCEHEVLYSVIHHAGRIDKTYTPSVRGSGVGIHLAHNLFCHNPSSLVALYGNDFLVEYNEFHSAVLESDDQGAVDTYGNPTFRGNVYRYNYFHDIGKLKPDPTRLAGDAGIRLDDAISGTLIYGNIFERSAGGDFGSIQLNSGRDNRIVNNLFLTGRVGISGGYCAENPLWTCLRKGANVSGFYFTELYYGRYPELRHAVETDGTNFFERNVFSDVGRIYNWNGCELKNNLLLKDGDLSIQSVMERAVKEIGFEPIPFEKIGPGIAVPEACRSIERKVEWKPAPRKIEGSGRILPEWRVLGSFDESAALPENLTVPPEEFLGKKAVVFSAENGEVDLKKTFGASAEKRVFYLYLPVETAEDGLQTFGFDADQLYDCYLDGKLLYSTGNSKQTTSSVSPLNHFETADLKAGKHTLFFRVVNAGNFAQFAADCGKSLKEKYFTVNWWEK